MPPEDKPDSAVLLAIATMAADLKEWFSTKLDEKLGAIETNYRTCKTCDEIHKALELRVATLERWLFKAILALIGILGSFAVAVIGAVVTGHLHF